MEVLARHSARLGDAGLGLEDAVHCFLRARGSGCAASRAPRCWSFLERADGLLAFALVKQRFLQVYDELDRDPRSDCVVRGLFASRPTDAPAPPPPLPSPPPSCACVASGAGFIDLPVSDLRWAHEMQSERFHNDPGKRGLLTLAVELLSGVTRPEDVPEIAFTFHEGVWYCRGGHRRLASLRLAQRFLPSTTVLWVRGEVKPADRAFTDGEPGHEKYRKQKPKLRTHLNGEHCKGKWMVIEETGEVVGCAEEAGVPEYGVDLLAMLFNTVWLRT